MHVLSLLPFLAWVDAVEIKSGNVFITDNIYQSTHQSLRVRSTSTWHERDIELDLIVVLEISILMLRVKSTRSRPDNGNDIVHILSTKGPAL